MIASPKQLNDEYSGLLKTVFNTPEGIRLLKHLQDIYCLKSSLSNDIHQTMYHLGQKELVQDLIKEVNDRSSFDKLDIFN